VANYRQTVLADFQAVEDNLAGLRILATEVGQYQDAVQSAAHYLDLSVELYRTGLDSYLNVVTAQNTLLTDRVTEVQAQLRQMGASVSLVMALGGGWDVSQLPDGEKTSEKNVKWTPATQKQATVPIAPANPPHVPPISLPANESPPAQPAGSKP
jgi:hypothetical protein